MSRLFFGHVPRWLAPGLALCLCAGAALFWLAVLQPAQLRVGEARMRATRQHAAQPGHQPARSRGTAALPPETTFPDALGKLALAAQAAGLGFDEGSYQVARLAQGKVVRYEITLPLQGSYAQVRAFLDGAVAAVPALVIENVQLQRHKVDDPALDARLRLAVLMEARP